MQNKVELPSVFLDYFKVRVTTSWKQIHSYSTYNNHISDMYETYRVAQRLDLLIY